MSLGKQLRYVGLSVFCTLALVACSDATEGDSNNGINGGFTVTTSLNSTTAPIGAPVQVICTVTDANAVVLDVATEFSHTPQEGLTRDGSNVTGTVVGTYEIVCAVPSFGLTDHLGASLTIIDAVPARVTTNLNPEVVQIGEASTVTCTVTDAAGTEIGMPTHVTAGADVVVAEHSVSSQTTGAHEITCHATGFSNITEESATLMVLSGDPVGVELRVKPDKAVYKVGQDMTFIWVGLDPQGNEVPDLPGTLSIPVDGFAAINVSLNKYKAV
jgi:hypothetical protein